MAVVRGTEEEISTLVPPTFDQNLEGKAPSRLRLGLRR